MKLKDGYILKEIATEYIVVPIGQEAVNFNGIITLNESGALLFQTLQNGSNKESLLQLLLDTYNVSKEQAQKDLNAFLEIVEKQELLA